jgi:3-oxoisoapionate decarboxylase
MLRIGLNAYGLTYTLGLQGAGTARANPNPGGLPGFLAIADEIGVRSLELDAGMLAPLDEAAMAELRDRLRAGDVTPVISAGLSTATDAIALARRVGAATVRLGLTPVLCGDRAAFGLGPAWAELVAGVRQSLASAAKQAVQQGVTLAIEDHQDFTHAELIELCATCGPGVGICLDTANPLAVGEEPLAFAQAVAPYLKHIHLKDYWVQWTDEGYRLIRCPVGDGAIPFAALASALRVNDPAVGLTASIEIGALVARHVRLLTASWWQGYAERPARDLAAALCAARARRLAEDAEWRTPWEAQADGPALMEYELSQVRRSAANLRAMGWMQRQD